MLASLATIMKEKTALVTSMVYFALTIFVVSSRQYVIYLLQLKATNSKKDYLCK